MKEKLKKGSDKYLIELTDKAIGDLVYEKVPLFKAYNYYHGIRDQKQFEYLEHNKGIQSPTSVKFTPFIRRHIDAIVGEYLTTEPRPKISCKDEKTLNNIMRQKQLEVAKQNHDYVKKFLDNAIYEAIAGKPQQQQKLQDPVITRELKELEESVNRNFISNYEMAGQTIIQYILQNRRIDFSNKEKDLLLDLLIAGEAYYRCLPTSGGTNFDIEIEDPLNTFVERNTKSRYMKDGYRAVIRKWMSKQEILVKYGNEMTKSDIESLDDYSGDYAGDNIMLMQACSARCGGRGDYKGLLQGITLAPETIYNYHDRWDLIPVYEVEWYDFDKEDGKIVGKRYETVRIGDEIYILRGEDEDQIRDMDSPTETRLTINGIYYTDRTGAPYSLMLATADIQDQYDLTIFWRDNLMALSGTKGSIIDAAQLPAFLGDELEERIIKHQAYRKTGTYIIDSSQDGDVTPPNTIYNGFDETISPQSMQAIQLAIDQLEQTASQITGVFRERLGGIQQRDAVANVEVGMQQSFIITKQYYQAMDTIIQEMMIDALNLARKVYKKGLTGQLILGGELKTFTLLPEYYSFTNYDVHLGNSSEIIKEMETLKQMAIQLVGNNNIDPEMLIIISTAKGMTEMKENLRKAIQDKKMENNQIQQLQQALQEAQQNVEKMQKQLEKTTTKLNQLNEKQMAMQQQDNTENQRIDWYKAQTDAKYKEEMLKLEQQRTQLEIVQLQDSNPNNNEINNYGK